MSAPSQLWRRENLLAWLVAPPFDAVDRTPAERAAMLVRLGFRRYVFMVTSAHSVADVEAELDALAEHGIELAGLRMTLQPEDPALPSILAAVAARGLRPPIWVIQSLRPAEGEEALARDARVAREADRIQRYLALTRPHDIGVALYNHNGWFGRVENELAILEELAARGTPGAGLVYNFSHARDEDHDDSVGFAALWARMRPFVLVVNVTGMRWEHEYVYPSQGDAELEMMRSIETSGWSGPVGLIGEMGGDAEQTLAGYLRGLDWLAAELATPGSAGPRPFPELPPR